MAPALLEALLGNLAAAALLGALAVLADRLLRCPSVTHALWLIVLLKLVTPPVVTVPVRVLPPEPAAAPVTPQVARPPVTPEPRERSRPPRRRRAVPA